MMYAAAHPELYPTDKLPTKLSLNISPAKIRIDVSKLSVKQSTAKVVSKVASLNRYNRKMKAYEIISSMYAANAKRADIILALGELDINSNNAAILIQKWRTESGLAELRSECTQ